LVLVLGASLVGCGSGADRARAALARQVGEPNATAAPAPAAAGGDADMVSAASPGGAGSPISLKFSLSGRPVVGEGLQIHVALLPVTDNAVRRLYGTFSPGEGLMLQSQRTFEFRDLSDGVALHQEVTVVPQQPGVLSLSATLVVDFDTGSVSQTFGIPLIATAPPDAASPAH
jgi:hypothetical protein